MMIRTLLLSLFSFLLTCTATFASTPIASEGDDAYRLGLKYEPVTDAATKAEYLKYTSFKIQLASGNIVISAQSERGILYGTFALLRHLQIQQPVKNLSISSAPKIRYRRLNHWDNTDGTIERGYAGGSYDRGRSSSEFLRMV